MKMMRGNAVAPASLMIALLLSVLGAYVCASERKIWDGTRDEYIPRPGFIDKAENLKANYYDQAYETEWTRSTGGKSTAIYIVSQEGKLLRRRVIRDVPKRPQGKGQLAIAGKVALYKVVYFVTDGDPEYRGVKSCRVYLFSLDGKREGLVTLKRGKSWKAYGSPDGQSVIFVSEVSPMEEEVQEYEIWKTDGTLIRKGIAGKVRKLGKYAGYSPLAYSALSDKGNYVVLSSMWQPFRETDLTLMDFSGRLILNKFFPGFLGLAYEVREASRLVVTGDNALNFAIGNGYRAYDFSGRLVWTRTGK